MHRNELVVVRIAGVHASLAGETWRTFPLIPALRWLPQSPARKFVPDVCRMVNKKITIYILLFATSKDI